MFPVHDGYQRVEAGWFGRLIGWRARGVGTDYMPSPTSGHGFGVWWRVVERGGVLSIQPGIDYRVLGVAILLAGVLAGVLVWVIMNLDGVVWAVAGVFTLVALAFVVVLVASPRQLAAQGPALRVERRGHRLTLNAKPAGTPDAIERIECVAFVYCTPHFNERGRRRGGQYTWGSHLVVVLREGEPRYVPIACVGSNLRRTGRRLAEALGVPFAWTHLGVLEARVDTPG
ncbi:MAG: hypothetical protein AAGI54_13660 [Planctomycetota bacterium]